MRRPARLLKFSNFKGLANTHLRRSVVDAAVVALVAVEQDIQVLIRKLCQQRVLGFDEVFPQHLSDIDFEIGHMALRAHSGLLTNPLRAAALHQPLQVRQPTLLFWRHGWQLSH